MYGSYAHVDDVEEDSVSGSFNIASLVDSSRKYKRRLGQKDRGAATTSFKPVRIGSVTKSVAPARRFLGSSKSGGSNEFHRKMSDIADADEEVNEEGKSSLTNRGGDVSLSEAFLDSLRLDSAAGGEAKNTSGDERLRNLSGQDKVSSDSGSFTMTQPETNSVEQTETELPEITSERGFNKPVRMGRGVGGGLGSTVRMNFGGPVRMNKYVEKENVKCEMKTESDRLNVEGGNIRDLQDEQNKENMTHPTGLSNGTNPKKLLSTPMPLNTSRIRERLQVLSGSHTSTAPLAPLQNTPTIASLQNTPSMPPQVQITPTLPQIVKSTTLPPQVQTPRPNSSSTSAAVRPEPTMPPPSMAISCQSKDQVLVIRGRQYRVMKLLGKGGSSRVYEALDEEKSIVVAIKRVDLSEADEAQTAGYVNEINMLSQLQGEDRIVKLYDYENVEAEDILYVVMERGDTDLASLLKKYSTKREITSAMIKHYWTEMLHAVSVIHKRNIIHKDLKPANFLLVAGRLKLIDFGIASSVQSDKTSVLIDNQMGTFNFMSPESIQDLNGPQFDNRGIRKPCIKISFKSDVWSLGCILYQLTYGKMPFGDIKHPLMKLQAITNADHAIQFPTLPDSDPILVSVIKDCLVRDQKKRPSIAELLNHSYVTGIEVKEQKKLDPLQSLIMLDALKGVLSPNTFNKTKEGFATLRRAKGNEDGDNQRNLKF